MVGVGLILNKHFCHHIPTLARAGPEPAWRMEAPLRGLSSGHLSSVVRWLKFAFPHPPIHSQPSSSGIPVIGSAWQSSWLNRSRSRSLNFHPACKPRRGCMGRLPAKPRASCLSFRFMSKQRVDGGGSRLILNTRSPLGLSVCRYLFPTLGNSSESLETPTLI